MADVKRARLSASQTESEQKKEQGPQTAGGSKPAAAASPSSTSSSSSSSLKYNVGWGNHFATEALPGALPVGQNSPQRCPYGLYAEQLTGTAFTAPRAQNRRSWLYRIRPSVAHQPFQPAPSNPFDNDFAHMETDPSQMRWSPMPVPRAPEKVTFVHGVATVGGDGDPGAKNGLCIYLYAFNASMGDSAFYNSDGEMLIVPQLGNLHIRSEMGQLDVAVGEILVVPRGIKFSVDLQEGVDGARGYILELFEGHFQLPELGPIGANCLANPRDFEAPVAWYEDRDVPFVLLNKFGGKLFTAAMDHSAFDVVAWHGNMTPYKYDLSKFICLNSVTKDHPDPSIYTVLTCPSARPGVAVADFVIFPPRWMVMEGFRPPWYHRNTMTEFMGMIWGKYDAKKGFVAGGSSLHSCMSAHGPDAPTFEAASKEEMKPVYFGAGLAFMFETSCLLKLSKFATDGSHRNRDYTECWRDLPKNFDPKKK